MEGKGLPKVLVDFLARKLGVKNSQSQVEIISGHTTREKIWGLTTTQSTKRVTEKTDYQEELEASVGTFRSKEKCTS